MLVRPADPADAHGIAVVHVRAWQAAYRGLMPQEVLDRLSIPQREAGWERILSGTGTGTGAGTRAGRAGARGPASRTIVAEADGEVVGWASFGEPRDDGSDGGELWGLYAHPAVWSRGVGHALITAVEQELREDGHRSAYLWVLDGNVRAAAFYESHGWIEDGATKVEERPGLTLLERRRVTQFA
ncbi:GNAT superfamily N-acetyltransferase [Microbacterium resistens]|uniref:GNAT superfamily N-acetyltransferase n=1 Tax=Microbacterium resistens TaxID=156977 RepID=A0ABU1SC20_9MICO|nr:GNAT family N-acetyltransferase [Microbacterium resistens]MDR6867149.1 GNAT superfamily N-acetyltransferase [Microbacterium resistens]